MKADAIHKEIVQAVRFPLAHRLAMRLHLAEVTRPQFQEAMKKFGYGFERYKSFGKEVWSVMKSIRDHDYPAVEQLKHIVEELPL